MISEQEGVTFSGRKGTLVTDEVKSSILVGRKNTNSNSAGYTIGLLKFMGVPNQMLYVRHRRSGHINGSFWLRSINHLEILECAKRLFRKRIRAAHPDKFGGNLEPELAVQLAEQTVQLNRAWSAIKRRFREHGHEL